MKTFLKIKSSLYNNSLVCANFITMTFHMFPFLISALYLAGVLGVPSTPGILGFTKGAKPDFCLSEFSYYYKHPRIWKAKSGSDISLFSKKNLVKSPQGNMAFHLPFCYKVAQRVEVGVKYWSKYYRIRYPFQILRSGRWNWGKYF